MPCRKRRLFKWIHLILDQYNNNNNTKCSLYIDRESEFPVSISSQKSARARLLSILKLILLLFLLYFKCEISNSINIFVPYLLYFDLNRKMFINTQFRFDLKRNFYANIFSFSFILILRGIFDLQKLKLIDRVS